MRQFSFSSKSIIDLGMTSSTALSYALRSAEFTSKTFREEGERSASLGERGGAFGLVSGGIDSESAVHGYVANNR